MRIAKPLDFSIGGWCLVNPGGDPFGDAVRNISTDRALEVLCESPIKKVSFHDRDLWSDDTSWEHVQDVITVTREQVNLHGLEVFNFTANLFSNPCFRSGAFSSPFPEVRAAAIVKGTRAMDAADAFGAKNVIWWGGREGNDGAYEQDPGVGLRRYMQGLKVCVQYGLEKKYDFVHTIEPKVYEPRLLMLYAGTGASAASAIRHFFPEPQFFGRVFVNPEYPQHVAMLGLDPVFELGQLMEEGMLAPFIHFGGQIPGRMDCDLPPGWGSNLYTDFMLCLTLHRRNWQGVIEFDCRPPRTTVTIEGLAKFLNRACGYWRMLERKVQIYFDDPTITQLEAELDRVATQTQLDLVDEVETTGGSVLTLVKRLQRDFDGFEAAAKVNTDCIADYQERVSRILQGRI